MAWAKQANAEEMKAVGTAWASVPISAMLGRFQSWSAFSRLCVVWKFRCLDIRSSSLYCSFKGRVAWDFWALVFFYKSIVPRPQINILKYFWNFFCFRGDIHKNICNLLVTKGCKTVLRWPNFSPSNHKPRHVQFNRRWFLYIYSAFKLLWLFKI